MRLFFAIPLPEGLKDDLAAFQACAKRAGIIASWPDPAGLHLTLAFLGEQEEAAVAGLMEVALRVAAHHPAFPLRTSRLGGFPKDRSARVLWMGLEEQPELSVLNEELRSDLRAAGMAFDEKPFKAHLTLARFKTPTDVARLQEPPAPRGFEARALVLYRSVPTPAGTRYVAQGNAPLP